MSNEIATKLITANDITDAQIEEFLGRLRKTIRERRQNIPTDAAEQVLLLEEDIGTLMFTPLLNRASVFLNFIVRTTKVNRSRSSQEAIEATGRMQYTDRKVVDEMPKGEGDEVEVVFFKPDLPKLNGFISDNDLEKEFNLRGLRPADPISVAAVNETDPAFADQIPHGTHWKDANNRWCHASFRYLHERRSVNVNHYSTGWNGHWWFAGVRKH